jgi:hypothetical protein
MGRSLISLFERWELPMIAFERGRSLAAEYNLDPPADLRPLLESLSNDLIPWRFGGRLREVVIESRIGIDDRLSGSWTRWLTAHALGHHLLHTGTSLYLESWQWVGKLKAERQAEEFAAGLLCAGETSTIVTPRGLARRAGIPEAKAVLAIQLLNG